MADEPRSTAAGGGLVGVNHLQTSVDGLKRTIDNLNQGLSKVVPQLQTMNRLTAAGGMGGVGAGAYPSMGFWGNNGGQGPTGGKQQSRGTNGGGATFGGGSGGRGGGAGGADDDDQKKPGFIGRVMGTAGGKAGLAVGAGVAANAGLNSMIQKAGPGMYTADLIASQLSLGGANTRQATLDSMKGQVSGLSMADVAQGRYTLSRGLGIQSGTPTDSRAQSATGIAGLINPGIGNAQVAQVMTSLNAPETSVKLRGIGVGTGGGAGNHMDPLTLANQILQKIGNWQSINTADKINFHVDDPNGAVASTLRNWEAHGFLPPGSGEVVKEEIRAILIARMNGTDFGALQKLGSDAGSANRDVRKSALDKLKKAGVNPTSIVGEQKELGAAKRDRDLDMTDSFAAGARNATDALTAFTEVINKLLSGPIGDAVGYAGGFKGVVGGGGGNGSDIGAMSNLSSGSGGTPDEKMGNSSQGTPLTTSTLGSGSNVASGAPGTQSGSGKATGSGKKTIKFTKPVAGAIGSGFGTRKDPITGRGRMHTGIDFRASNGTPIHASAAGTVTFSGSRGASYWAGNHVIIDHGGGYESLYAHQSRVKARVGASVQQGEVIGYVGSTGRSTGAHLHFEIHINGRPVNPAPYLSGSGVAVSDSTVSSASDGSSQSTSAAGSESGAQSMGMSGSAGSGILTGELAALMAFSGAGAGNTGTTPGNTTAPGAASTSSSNNATANNSNVPTAPSSVTGNKLIVKQMAAAKGWTGKEWDALYKLVMGESGFKNTAQNPTSSAFGMFQFLNGTWAGYGVKKTSDPRGQTQAGLAYISQRYGTPSKALSKWQARSPHWYDTGAWEVPRDEDAVVHKGEMVVPAKEARQIREVLLNGSAYGANSKLGQGGAGGLQITIEQGAITVSTTGGVTSTGINDLGKAIADALAQHDKIKKLTEGVLS